MLDPETPEDELIEESPEETPEDSKPLFGDDSVDDTGDLGDEQVEEEETDEVDEEPDKEPEKERVWAKKYKSPEELERAYEEAQSTLTRTQQERKDLLKFVQGIAITQATGKDGGKPTEEDVQNKIDDILTKISTEENYLPNLIRQVQREDQRTAEEYDTTIDTAVQEAISSIEQSESFGNQFTPEVRTEMQKDVDGNELVRWLMNEVVTSDNFKSSGVDINQFYGKVMDLLSQAALGRIAAKIVPEAKVKARREAKKEYLQKGRMVSQKPKAKSGKLSKPKETDSFGAFLASRAQTKQGAK